MKKYIHKTIGWIAVLLFLVGALRSVKIYSRAGTSDSQPEGPRRSRGAEMAGILLNDCRDDRLGIAFLCDYTWEKKPNTVDATIFIVDKGPDVIFKFIKVNVDIRVIQQLSRDKLEAIGQYQEGFVMEEAVVAGFNAIKVKAFSRENPALRVTDYYFVRNEALYAVMFSVAPKEQWDNYKFVFQKIVNSLKFIQ
jgi:hypothetical protein